MAPPSVSLMTYGPIYCRTRHGRASVLEQAITLDLLRQQVPLLRKRAELPRDVFLAAFACTLGPLFASSGTFATLLGL